MASNNRRWVLFLSTALVAFTASPVLAQTTKAKTTADIDCKVTLDDPACKPADKGGSTYLSPLVVSGAGFAGGVGDPYATPAAVSTVGSEEINMFGGQNLDNVLRTQPGTFTRDNGENPGIAVNIRGFEGSGRVAMSIDGAKQNFRFTNHEAQGFTYVDPAMLSGVDITRGSDPGANGAGALGGSANFRTLGVSDVIKDGKSYGAYTSLTVGSNGGGTSEAAAGAFRVNDTFAILGAFSKRNPTDYANADGAVVPHTAQDILSGLVKAEITPTLDQKLTISGLFYNDKFFANAYPQQIDNRTYSLLYDYTPEDNDLVDLHIGLHRNETRMEWFNNGSPANPPFGVAGGSSQGRLIQDNAWGVDATNTSRGALGDVGLKSTYGISYTTDDVAVRNTTRNVLPGVNPPGTTTLASVFTSTTLSYNIVDLIAGLRYDHFTATGKGATSTGTAFDLNRSEGRFNPAVTVSVKATDWLQPYVRYAETFRPPTANELLMGGSHPGTTSSFEPNPALKPEVARTWEGGVNVNKDDVFAPGDSVSLKADYFYSSVEAAITGIISPKQQFVNNPGISHVQGFELQAGYDAGVVFGGLGYTHTTDDRPTTIDGLGAVTALPADILTATLAGRFLDDQSLTIGTRFYAVSQTDNGQGNFDNDLVSSRYAPAYQLVDLFANYQLENGIELSANVSNVFNVSYSPALSTNVTSTGPATGRGRSFEVTAKAAF